MSTDHELLERAAKAAGVEITWLGDQPTITYTPEESERRGGIDGYCWNPLTDDGDALRLAVAIGAKHLVFIEIGRSGVDVEFDCSTEVASERGADVAAATRRAIVRAAAAMAEGAAA